MKVKKVSVVLRGSGLLSLLQREEADKEKQDRREANFLERHF